jgi:hypothetical protein
MSPRLLTQLVLDALDMALAARRAKGVIHHSDQGSQYTSIEFGQRCREAGVRPSMGSVGDAYDNAMCESFFATLECELLARRRFKSQSEARTAIFEFIEGFYNRRRRHSSIGYLSPVEYEHQHIRPDPPQLVGVLAAVKDKPCGRPEAVLDGRFARQLRTRAGDKQIVRLIAGEGCALKDVAKLMCDPPSDRVVSWCATRLRTALTAMADKWEIDPEPTSVVRRAHIYSFRDFCGFR